MKRLLIIAALLSMVYDGSAQKIRFSEKTNKWNVYYSEHLSQTFPWQYTSDSVINGMEYHLLEGKVYGGGPVAVWIREDTLLNKVFYIRNSNFVEYVLYDYNLRVGDPEVISQDSIFIDHSWYKRWTFGPAYLVWGWPDYDVVEGIGTLYGPLQAIYPDNSANYRLSCFQNKFHSSTIITPYGNIPSCNITGVPQAQSAFRALQIIPSPATSQAKMVLPHSIQSGQIDLFNASGQLIIRIKIANSKEIAIGHYLNAPGVYFYKVSDFQNGFISTGHFIFQ